MKIIVDLDGTLIEKDSSFAIWKKMFKQNPFAGFKALVLYFVKGEAGVKEYTKTFFTNSSVHKINEKLIAYLKKLKAQKSHLILATGANFKTAVEFNKKHKLFTDVIASDEKINCIGVHKLQAIKKLIGNDKFMYIGDAWYDCPIWHEANVIGVVKPNMQMHAYLSKIAQRRKKELVIFD